MSTPLDPPDSADSAVLRSQTPPTWAAAVLREPLALLDDHAHLERKAASNALALVHRRPDDGEEPGAAGGEPGGRWARTLTAIARDEVEHLGVVLRLLERRGARLSRGHSNPYAAALHRQVRQGDGMRELLDRLLIATLIEARSAERFERLVEACPAAGADDELRRLYRGLLASERGHQRQFLDLAGLVAGPVDVAARLGELAEAEAAILRAQPPGPRIHSGAP